jgi:hypothetical protein
MVRHLWCSWLSRSLHTREVPGSIPGKCIFNLFTFLYKTINLSIFALSLFPKVELVQDHLLFANRTVLLLYQPVLYALAVMHVSALQDSDVLPFVYLVVTDAADFFRKAILLVFRIRTLF